MHEIRIIKSVISHQDPRPSLNVATVAERKLDLSDHIRVRDPSWLELLGLALKTSAIGVTVLVILFAALEVWR